MSDKSAPVMFARQAAELDHAFERNGWTPNDVKWLSTGDNLAQILYVRQGVAEIIVKPMEHIIDCDGDPFVPDGWSLAPKSEQLPGRIKRFFKCDPKLMQLHLSEHQLLRQGDYVRYILGRKLREELQYLPVLPANVLDYLFANQHLIPEEWKKKTSYWETEIFFWGTIYRILGDDDLCVRCLCWRNGKWTIEFSSLRANYCCSTPAVISAVKV